MEKYQGKDKRGGGGGGKKKARGTGHENRRIFDVTVAGGVPIVQKAYQPTYVACAFAPGLEAMNEQVVTASQSRHTPREQEFAARRWCIY